MRKSDYLVAYELIRDTFIDHAEHQHVPISPMLGRSQEAAIGGVVYSEWRSDRGLQIAVSHPDAPTNIDVAITTMPYESNELPLIKVFSSDVALDLDNLWEIRCIWFDPAFSPRGAGSKIRRMLNRRRIG